MRLLGGGLAMNAAAHQHLLLNMSVLMASNLDQTHVKVGLVDDFDFS
jgi:hypothetical protein